MRIASLQHVPFEDSAAIGDWAARRGHPLAAVQLDRGERAPAPEDYDLLLIMGGPMNIYEEEKYPWLAGEKRAIRAGLDAGKAMLGVCLGAQLMADVLGGPVTRNAQKEIGWFPVKLRSEAAACPLMAGWPETLESFHWHGDTFAIPPGAVHLASSAACANQAFLHGNRALGLQFHMEYRADSIRAMLKECDDEIEAGGAFVQSYETILAGLPKLPALHACLERMLDAFESMLA